LIDSRVTSASWAVEWERWSVSALHEECVADVRVSFRMEADARQKPPYDPAAQSVQVDSLTRSERQRPQQTPLPSTEELQSENRHVDRERAADALSRRRAPPEEFVA
jgi:hypothetical protein